MDEVELKGEITRIVFTNPANGYTVAHLRPPGGGGEHVIVGAMPSLCEGEELKVRGRWVQTHRFGRQFKVEHCEPIVPSTPDGLERYLSSGAIPGVGKKIAARLVQFFGAELPQVLDQEPERLTDVPGIGPAKADSISQAWREKVANRQALVSLYGYGVGTALAARLLDQYGRDALKVVRDTPYRLASEVHGVGFLTADRLAGSVGVAKDSPARVEAGIAYFLDQQAGEGHCFYPQEPLAVEVARFLEVDQVLVEQAIARMIEARVLRADEGDEGLDLYLPRLYRAEVLCARALRRLSGQGGGTVPEHLARRALQAGLRASNVDLTAEQVDAVRLSLSSRCSIITGGPGTGKTTVIKAIITGFLHNDLNVALCAPTGRAAKRMTEATGVEARTIHRLLEYNPAFGRFARDQHCPVEAEAVVVDEVSMIDVELMSCLLAALPPDCRLVLVGDKDQLEPVGPGAVLRDLIASRALPTARLTEIHRQAERSLIILNSHRILSGEWLQLPSRTNDQADFYFLEKDDPEACVETIVELVVNRIPARFGHDPLRDVQVIVPTYKGPLGADNLNARLQNAINPHGIEARKGERVFRTGDRIMQIRNNYEKEVFNGDIGFIRRITDAGMEVRLVDDRVVSYTDSDLDELTLAYAVTVHKSQGSEYPAVVVVLHNQHWIMLRRNLFYTAVTRGKRLVVLAGTKRAAAMAIRNDQTRQRYTRLALRLKQPEEPGAGR